MVQPRQIIPFSSGAVPKIHWSVVSDGVLLADWKRLNHAQSIFLGIAILREDAILLVFPGW